MAIKLETNSADVACDCKKYGHYIDESIHDAAVAHALLQAKADYLAQRDRWEPDGDTTALEWIDERAALILRTNFGIE